MELVFLVYGWIVYNSGLIVMHIVAALNLLVYDCRIELDFLLKIVYASPQPVLSFMNTVNDLIYFMVLSS
jgi:hypothetical protein